MTKPMFMLTMSMLAVCLVCDRTQAADPPAVTCGDVLTRAQLEQVLGAGVEYDAKRKPLCRFKAGKGLANGTIQVFRGDARRKYEQMLAGAKKSLAGSGKLTETGATGKKSFEFVGKKYGIDMVQLGFEDTSGRYAVLLNLGAGWAEIENARKLATRADTNLKKR